MLELVQKGFLQKTLQTLGVGGELEKPRKVFLFGTQCCGYSNWVEWNFDQECRITSLIGCRESRKTKKKCNKFKDCFVCNLYL